MSILAQPLANGAIASLRLDQSEIKTVLSRGTTTSEIAVRVQLFLATIRASGLCAQFVTEGMHVLLLVETFDVHHLHLELGQDTVLVISVDDHVGTVVVELRGRVSGPRERKQALVRIKAGWHILWDLDGPLVVN